MEVILWIIKAYLAIGVCFAIFTNICYVIISNSSEAKAEFLTVCEEDNDDNSEEYKQMYIDMSEGRFNARALLCNVLYVLLWPWMLA